MLPTAKLGMNRVSTYLKGIENKVSKFLPDEVKKVLPSLEETGEKYIREGFQEAINAAVSFIEPKIEKVESEIKNSKFGQTVYHGLMVADEAIEKVDPNFNKQMENGFDEFKSKLSLVGQNLDKMAPDLAADALVSIGERIAGVPVSQNQGVRNLLEDLSSVGAPLIPGTQTIQNIENLASDIQHKNIFGGFKDLKALYQELTSQPTENVIA